MDAPEYLDLDEIDFTDDLAYSVTSLKNIPELCRKSESQSEERQAPPINWSRGINSHGGNGIKPTGIADVHSKFRPVKRVSPLKHQPEVPDTETDCKGQGEDGGKEDSPDKVSRANVSRVDEQGFKGKNVGGEEVFGELEHYDLDMDEILDVPYIKSSQQMGTLPRVTPEKRPPVSAPSDRNQACRAATLPHSETLGFMPPYCVLSPVKCPEMRKSKSMESEHLRQSVARHNHTQLGTATSELEKLLPSRTYLEPRAHKPAPVVPGSQPKMFSLPDCGGAWGSPRAHGEGDEDAKKAQNIISIIRGGQISLLPHLAADNLELIRDEEGNNLLHISASRGHAECLQHLTSLMGEDCLSERNSEQLTPAGLGIKNGHLECVRWMVSETEAIAELSCSRDHPSLIHYAARYGQEKILLWLLQFMQEQAISLDELDQQGNSAVHVAAQYGHLGCIQTLVEYGSNVTVQNQQGERPSQTAERHGHTTCSRYLVVVETCMSLASQVVKLTKQINEQTSERVTLQNQVQQLLDSPHRDGSPTRPPSWFIPSMVPWPEMTLTAEAASGGQCVLRQRDVDSDVVLRQLLGKEIAEKVCSQGRLTLEFREPRRPGAGPGAGQWAGPAGRRELKLARLKQLMQRSLSESDSDAYPAEEQKQGVAAGRAERPRQLALAESDEASFLAKRNGSAAERKLSFVHGASKSMDGYNPSPTSDGSDHDREPKPETPGGGQEHADMQKATTSPKSALKSPSSRRKPSQTPKLRVTFDESLAHKGGQDTETRGTHEKGGGARTAGGSEVGEVWKRPFGTFRSIMESLGGNQNSNNSNGQCAAQAKQPSSGLAQGSPGRKAAADAKANPSSLSKSKNKSSAV